MAEKRKTKTSASVKNRYARGHYKQLNISLKFDEFDEFEALRGEKNKADFLRELIVSYKKERA